MRAAGSLQWQNGYPGPEHIAADLFRGYGRVLCRPSSTGDAEVVAYGAVSFDGEPAYDAIEGSGPRTKPMWSCTVWRWPTR